MLVLDHLPIKLCALIAFANWIEVRHSSVHWSTLNCQQETSKQCIIRNLETIYTYWFWECTLPQDEAPCWFWSCRQPNFNPYIFCLHNSNKAHSYCNGIPCQLLTIFIKNPLNMNKIASVLTPWSDSLGVVYTMDHEVVPRPCKISD